MTTKKIDKKTKESKQTKKNNGLKQKITLKVPLIYPEQTLQEAQDILLKKLKNKEIETINYFYVIDQNKKLIGLFSIKELFLCDLKTKVKEVMKTQLIKADPQTDQEQVAYLALKNNIKAVPIVNQDNVFLGILTSDQILDILDKETSEDLLHLAGFYEPSQSFSLKNNLSIPILKSIKNRLPWLIVGLFGGILAARIINLFTNSLEKNLILAMFIPLIIYMGNAVGGQTQALFLRDLAISKKIPFNKYFLKQIITCFFIAWCCSFLFFLLALFVWTTAYISFVLSLSMFVAILFCVLFALIIPYFLNKFKLDPALGSGPFTTIIQDILSIVIYFSLASWLL